MKIVALPGARKRLRQRDQERRLRRVEAYLAPKFGLVDDAEPAAGIDHSNVVWLPVGLRALPGCARRTSTGTTFPGGTAC